MDQGFLSFLVRALNGDFLSSSKMQYSNSKGNSLLLRAATIALEEQ